MSDIKYGPPFECRWGEGTSLPPSVEAASEFVAEMKRQAEEFFVEIPCEDCEALRAEIGVLRDHLEQENEMRIRLEERLKVLRELAEY